MGPSGASQASCVPRAGSGGPSESSGNDKVNSCGLHTQRRQGSAAECRRRCGRGEPSLGADVAGGGAQSQCRCGTGWARTRRTCGRGGHSDMAGASASHGADVQLRPQSQNKGGTVKSQCRCARASPSPGADATCAEPSPGADVGGLTSAGRCRRAAEEARRFPSPRGMTVRTAAPAFPSCPHAATKHGMLQQRRGVATLSVARGMLCTCRFVDESQLRGTMPSAYPRVPAVPRICPRHTQWPSAVPTVAQCRLPARGSQPCRATHRDAETQRRDAPEAPQRAAACVCAQECAWNGVGHERP